MLRLCRHIASRAVCIRLVQLAFFFVFRRRFCVVYTTIFYYGVVLEQEPRRAIDFLIRLLYNIGSAEGMLEFYRSTK